MAGRVVLTCIATVRRRFAAGRCLNVAASAAPSKFGRIDASGFDEETCSNIPNINDRSNKKSVALGRRPRDGFLGESVSYGGRKQRDRLGLLYRRTQGLRGVTPAKPNLF